MKYKTNNRGYAASRAGRRPRHARDFALLAAACVFAALAVYTGSRYIQNGGLERFTRAPATEPPATAELTTAPPPALPPGVKVKGLYVTAWSAGMADRLAHYIELCDTTEINALVIDVKDDRGQITFLSSIEGAAQTSVNVIPEIEKTVRLLKEHGIYTIARLVCFKDPQWCALHPGLAIRNARGAPWRDPEGVAWLDPYNTAAWDYLADVAAEAARLGFDEVQLDYVRFPASGNLEGMRFEDGGKSRAEIIGEFLRHIRAALSGTGARLSADIFGITAIHAGDFENIGQDLKIMAQNADSVCPMVYPSHFANKRQNGVGQYISETLFEAPDTQPYEVVRGTLVLVKNRLRANGADAAVARPYLQDFTASYLGPGYYRTYTAEQVRAQIQAVYDAGFEEWILWNPGGTYSEAALLAETE